MTPEQSRQIDDLYQRARQLDSAARRTLLDSECGDNADVRAEVESLLSRTDPDATTRVNLSNGPGTARSGSLATNIAAINLEIPGYDIVRELHRGGQGVVYQAVQLSTKRKVAIKVTREGPFSGPADVARFEREVEILGQLHHPNIVAIHDSGTAAGHFYFVMDYISGKPLDAYIENQKPSVEDTMRLLARAAEAVNAAHLRGVIHRDIKPSNIRVDTEGEPFVLDFGLAKTATGDASAMTVTGQFMGSVPWASPEQAQAIPGRIDVRTDVYSLGVVLYQMLTGKFPYEVVGNMRDVLDNILHASPTKPRILRRAIDDEVETIVLKCLAKERERRYQTAGELARDIRHYLAGEPIEAKRDSGSYLLRKALRRHRVPLTVACVLVAATAIGLVVMSGLYVRATRAERNLAEVLASGDETLVAMTSIAKGVDQHDMVEDKVRAALELRTNLFGPDDQRTLNTKQTLAGLLYSQDKLEEAEQVQRAVLEQRRRALGADDPRTIQAEHALALQMYRQGRHADAAKLLSDVIAARRRVLGDDHEDTLEAESHEVHILLRQGQTELAKSRTRGLLERCRKHLGDAHPLTVNVLNDQAYFHAQAGEYAEAAGLLRVVLDAKKRTVGPRHPHVAGVMANLAELQTREGELAQAEALYRDVVDILREYHGSDHADVARHRLMLAKCLLDQDKLGPETEELIRDAAATFDRILGADNEQTLQTWLVLADLLIARESYADAERILVENAKMIENNASLAALHGKFANRLVQVYETNDNSEEAAKWRTQLAGTE